MKRPALLLLLLLALLLPLAAHGAPKKWWNRKWARRTKVVLSEHQPWRDAPAAHVRLRTGGKAKPDGSDIRVVTTDRKEVPHAVVARGPGDLFEVTFPVDGGTEWYVYFGNPKAEAPKEPYVPDRGLILETRKRGTGNPVSWAAMREIVRRSPRVYGGSYWPRVYDAENPFGPSDDFVSIYRGFILAPRDGTYTFYTASDEASFLLIGDRVVANWAGWHSAGRGAWAVFKGDIELTKGLHPFRYVHVERRGQQAMAAYWKTPGASKPGVIPPSAFPGLLRAEGVVHEALGKDVAADFVENVAERWGLNDQIVNGVRLKAVDNGTRARYLWDFGDGTTAEGRLVYHAYLFGGEFDVTLVVERDDETDRIVRRIFVPEEWRRTDRNKPVVLGRLADAAEQYPPERLDGRSVRRLVFLLEQAGRDARMIEVMEKSVRDSENLTEDERYTLAMELGNRIRDTTGDAQAAMRAFRLAESSARRGKSSITARVLSAEALLLLGGDARTAARLLETAVSALGKKGDKTARRAWMRLGDARMLLGEGPKAREAYETADDMAGGAEDVRRLLKKSAAARTAMSLIESRQGKRALKSLEEWAWLAPLDRYTGLHRIQNAKALRLLKREDEATRDLTGLVAGNPESEYADRALVMLAEIEEERGNAEKAAEYRERLKREYPWSPLAR